MDAEEHEHHEERDDDDALDVHPDALVRLLLVVFVGAPRLPDLQRQKHDPTNQEGSFTLDHCDYVNIQRADLFSILKAFSHATFAFPSMLKVNIVPVVTAMQRIHHHYHNV